MTQEFWHNLSAVWWFEVENNYALPGRLFLKESKQVIGGSSYT